MIYWKQATYDERRLLKAISLVLGKHPNLLLFVFEKERPRLRELPEILLEKSAAFSASEDLLVRVALDLWSGSGDAHVWEIIEYLDYDSLDNLIEGLRFCRTKFKDWDGPVCRQLKLDSDNSRRQLKLDIPSDI
jgi:hypothetical protein